MLKEEPLFENDYFPYLELVGIYQREKQFFKGISTILDFFPSEIYCDEIIFEQFRFYMDLFLRRSVLNLTEERSVNIILTPLKIKMIMEIFYRRILTGYLNMNSLKVIYMNNN